MIAPSDRFERAIAAFDAANAEDPTPIDVGGEARPRELVQAERLSAWMTRLYPEASEALRLAARCQHLRRWEIPRKSYADGRIGYLEWRKELSRFHARKAAEILRSVGYDDDTIARVERINKKTSIKADAEVQAMEDALCLAFLDHELAEFAAEHEDDKIVDIVQKTWRKMSARGHEEALKLPLTGRAGELVRKALAAESG
jgi:hypothetical protein